MREIVLMNDDEKAMVPGRRMGPKQADTVKAPFGASAPGVTPFVASAIGVPLCASASGVAPFGAGALVWLFSVLVLLVWLLLVLVILTLVVPNLAYAGK